MAAESSRPVRVVAAISWPRTPRGVIVCSPSTFLPAALRGETSQAARVGGGHGVVGGEEPAPGSAVAAGVTGRVSPERPEEKPRPLASPAAISRMGLGVDAGALPA